MQRGERDLLDEYCTLDEASQEMISQSKQEQDTSVRLPRILSWFVSSLNETSADATGQESRACCPGNVLDFVLEDGTMDCETGSGPATIRGTLRDVWTMLTKEQKQQLMLTLVRLLVDVWKNFDILDRSDFEYPLELSKEPCLQHCGVGQHASPMEQSLPTCVSHMSPISDYGQSSSPRNLEGSAEQTPARMSAAERLVYLEEKFLYRSFLDAFNQATASSPSDNHQLIDTMISVFDENLPAVPPESSPPKRRRVNTDQNEYSNRSANDSRGTCEEGMAWTLGSSQRVTTTRTQALEFMASQKSGSAVTPIDGDGSPGTGMRRFDFSIDDLLVVAPNETYSQDGDGQLYPSAFSKCEIIGVSRWKAGGGTEALNTQTQELAPRGNNVYQVRARGSTYPLVHLFSLPDIFCPVELGGQCVVKHLDSGGLAGEFVRLLGRHSLAAGEFLTDSLPDKERTLYHRWMAAWHERCPLAPKATRIRFELMRMVRKRHCAGVGMNVQWEHWDDMHTLNNGDDNNNEEEGVGIELKMAAPRAYKGLRPIQQGHSHAQQPSGGEVSSSAAANLKARCNRCMEEEHEQEMISEDKAWFDSTAKFLDEVQADEKRRGERQKMRRLLAARRDQSLDQLARQLGLGKQWMKEGRALGLQLDALGVASMDGAGAGTGSEAMDDASDSLGERSKPTWILSAEEREIMRMHLFGQGDQTAASAADTEAG
ncbi:hypothetical protein BGZ68_007548 [Mortierella alpina]|nr:hypothetical protein BGZ68_007548 [Mortierella alpina]